MYDFRLRTAEEVLAEMQAADYCPALVEGGAVAASVTTILGDPFVGKTQLAVNASRSLLSGADFLGRKVLRPVQSVAYLTTNPGLEFEMAERVEDAGIDLRRFFLHPFHAPPADLDGWRQAARE